MTRTTFRNASGLPNNGQLSTARDMATLALALIRDFPKYYRYFSTRSFKYRGRRYPNHNRLLTTYPGMDGLKTGYIRASGYNLAASAEREGRRLVAVVFGGKSANSRNRHMASLLNKGFQALKRGKDTDSEPLIAVNNPPPAPPGVAYGLPQKPDNVLMGLPTIPAEVAMAQKPKQKPAVWIEPKGPKLAQVGIKPEPPSEVAVGPPKGPVGWGIQVGAFKRKDPAKKALRQARRAAPRLLAHAQNKVVSVEKGGAVLYRARFFGLSRTDARQACRQLKRRKINCLAMSPKRLQVAQLN